MSDDRMLRNVVATLAALVVVAVAPSAFAHPKPGAHADVRLTVTPGGVRVDLLMNLMFVDGLVHAPRVRPDDVTTAEAAGIRVALREYFGSSADTVGGLQAAARGSGTRYLLDAPTLVRIDGVLVRPLERGYAVIHPALETRAGFEQNPLMLIPQIQLSLEYVCKAAPASVEIVWGTFPLDFLAQARDNPPPTQIEAILVAPGGVQEIVFRKEEPSFTWHNPGVRALAAIPAVSTSPGERGGLPVPSITLVLAGVLTLGVSVARHHRPSAAAALAAGTLLVGGWLLHSRWPLNVERAPSAPAREEALAIFRALHSNIYRAFDFTTEGEIYDALAQSVDGQLLDTLYTQVYTSLIMFEEGGAVSRVKSLESVEDQMSDPPAAAPPGTFRVQARWRVEGVVYHWGHSHTRLNEYLANYDVAPTPDGWRIVAVVPLEQFRVDPGSVPEAEREPGPEAWHPNR